MDEKGRKREKEIGRRRECVSDGSHPPSPCFRRSITPSHYVRRKNGTRLHNYFFHVVKSCWFLTEMIEFPRF